MENESLQENIIIDLQKIQLNNNTLSSRNEFIHREQLDMVCPILNKKIEDAKIYNPNTKFISQNDVISILARRGAGKTTFVKSLVHLIRKSNDHIFAELRENLLCIDVFEPNQIQNKENLLIRFLAHIDEMFRTKGEPLDPYNLDLYQQYEKATRKLFEALPVIDGVGSGNLFPDWDDTAYIADRYMNLASNVKELEFRLHCYIHKGLQLIGKKALLFILDDSDVNIERSFEILEIIRLYMTSPQIIVMLTGDSTLYGMIVRRKFWNYFDESFLHKECASINKNDKKFWEYHKQVYRLEAQYLQKLIKVEYRIFLNNIYDKKAINKLENKEEKYKFLIKLSENDVPKEIEELYGEILSKFNIGNRTANIKNIYVHHFLAQPFRNQLRLLSVYDQYLSQQGNGWEILTKGLLKVFEIYINQNTGDSKFLMAHSPIYPAWMLKFLIENRILNIGSNFLPEMEDDSLKNAIIAIGFSCSEQMRHQPGMIFDYWIRVSMSKQLSLLCGDQIFTDNHLNFIAYTKVYTDCGLDQIIGRMLAYSKGIITNNNQNSDTEILSIPGTIIREGIFSKKGYYTEVHLINLLQIESVSSSQKTSYIYSLYRPIAILGELLRITSTNKRYDLFSNLFNELYQVTCYMEPDVKIPLKNRILSKKRSIDDWLPNIKPEQSDKFIKELFHWSKQSAELNVAPFYVDRIFNRYFDSMLELTNDSNFHQISLGDFINKAVLTLWNSAIVETLIIINKTPSRLLSDDGGITAFIDNYIILLGINKLDNSFANWLIECPLLRAYVDPFIIELLKRIGKDTANLTRESILSCIENHINIEKSNHYAIGLEQTKKEIDETNAIIKNYETYNKLSDEMHFISNTIEIHEGQLRLEQIEFEKKMEHEKQIEQLTKKYYKLKHKQYQLEIHCDEMDMDDELNNLYKKLYQLRNEAKSILEAKEEFISSINNNDIYNEIQEKVKDLTSVYSILNHF